MFVSESTLELEWDNEGALWCQAEITTHSGDAGDATDLWWDDDDCCPQKRHSWPVHTEVTANDKRHSWPDPSLSRTSDLCTTSQTSFKSELSSYQTTKTQSSLVSKKDTLTTISKDHTPNSDNIDRSMESRRSPVRSESTQGCASVILSDNVKQVSVLHKCQEWIKNYHFSSYGKGGSAKPDNSKSFTVDMCNDMVSNSYDSGSGSATSSVEWYQSCCSTLYFSCWNDSSLYQSLDMLHQKEDSGSPRTCPHRNLYQYHLSTTPTDQLSASKATNPTTHASQDEGTECGQHHVTCSSQTSNQGYSDMLHCVAQLLVSDVIYLSLRTLSEKASQKSQTSQSVCHSTDAVIEYNDSEIEQSNKDMKRHICAMEPDEHTMANDMSDIITVDPASNEYPCMPCGCSSSQTPQVGQGHSKVKHLVDIFSGLMLDAQDTDSVSLPTPDHLVTCSSQTSNQSYNDVLQCVAQLVVGDVIYLALRTLSNDASHKSQTSQSVCHSTDAVIEYKDSEIEQSNKDMKRHNCAMEPDEHTMANDMSDIITMDVASNEYPCMPCGCSSSQTPQVGQGHSKVKHLIDVFTRLMLDAQDTNSVSLHIPDHPLLPSSKVDSSDYPNTDQIRGTCLNITNNITDLLGIDTDGSSYIETNNLYLSQNHHSDNGSYQVDLSDSDGDDTERLLHTAVTSVSWCDENSPEGYNALSSDSWYDMPPDGDTALSSENWYDMAPDGETGVIYDSTIRADQQNDLYNDEQLHENSIKALPKTVGMRNTGVIEYIQYTADFGKDWISQKDRCMTNCTSGKTVSETAGKED